MEDRSESSKIKSFFWLHEKKTQPPHETYFTTFFFVDRWVARRRQWASNPTAFIVRLIYTMNLLLVALSQYINPVMKQISLKRLYQEKNPIFCLETVLGIVFKYLVKWTNNSICT